MSIIPEGCRQIPLTQGKVAWVDEADYDWLIQWKWYAYKSGNTFYAGRKKGNYNRLSMHRLINSTPDGVLTDHKDGNGLHNWRDNLRDATRRQNACNKKSGKGSSSAFLGVMWNKRAKKWEARIKVNGKYRMLGMYKCEADAARAYDVHAIKYHKEFARPNFNRAEI